MMVKEKTIASKKYKKYHIVNIDFYYKINKYIDWSFYLLPHLRRVWQVSKIIYLLPNMIILIPPLVD